jgi:DNA adenine methylase
MLKTMVKWPGGKQKVIHESGRRVNEIVREMFEASGRSQFVDLFCGGLSISLEVAARDTLANDLNSDVINLYREVQKDGILTIYGPNHEGYFYVMRDKFNGLRGPITERERAELFYYLNRHCFNGLVRYSSDGKFNSSFGHYDYSNFEPDLTRYTETFKGWEFTAKPWQDVVIPPGSFVVADPPYAGTFDKYNAAGFSECEQVTLARALARHNGPVILFNSPEMLGLYTSLGFKVELVYRENKINKSRVAGDRHAELFATRNI